MEKKIVCPTPEQAEWAECELGVLITMDLQTFVPYDPVNPSSPIPEPSVFNPKSLDTDQWLEAAASIGAKYAVLVAKHCSGFALFPSDASDFTVASSPFRNGKGDIVADFIKSCEKYSIKPGIYYSTGYNDHLNVNRTAKGAVSQEEYNRIVTAQLTELWTRYGNLFEIWFDGGVLPPEKGGPDILTLLQKLQPDANVFQGPAGTKSLLRWVGNENGNAPYNCFSTVNMNEDSFDGNDGVPIESGDPCGNIWCPAESDTPNRYANRAYQGGWFWHEGEDDTVIPAEILMEKYYSTVGHNSNLLIGMAIDSRGLFPEKDAGVFRQFGQMIKQKFGSPLKQKSGQSEQLTMTVDSNISDIVISEDIRYGERVTAYSIEKKRNGVWTEIASGKCIGHKRIHRIDETYAEAVRLTVHESKAEPLFIRLSVY